MCSSAWSTSRNARETSVYRPSNLLLGKPCEVQTCSKDSNFLQMQLNLKLQESAPSPGMASNSVRRTPTLQQVSERKIEALEAVKYSHEESPKASEHQDLFVPSCI